MIPLGRFELEPPLSAEELEGVLAQAGFEVGPEIRELYGRCAGAYDEERDLQILPPAEALNFAEFLGASYPFMKYWPFLTYGPEGSDPYSMCCGGPLRGYVIHVSHDGIDCAKANGLESFMQHLAQVKEDDWSPSDERRFDSPGSADLAAALELLRAAEARLDTIEGLHLFTVGLDLVSDEDAAQVTHLLEHPRHEVREIAQDRLRDLAVAASARAAFQIKYAVFVKRAAEVLCENGLDAVVETDGIRVEPGSVCLNMPMFYDRKDDPEVWSFLLERTRYFLSLKR